MVVAGSATDVEQYPYLTLVNSLVPALLAGNTVIIKPSPQTPTVAEQVAKAFDEAGLPSGVLQYFHSGSPLLIESIVRDPKIALVCFIGSVAGGLAVQKGASDRIVNVGLELGGKDPAYIRSDVDIPWAAGEIVDGAVFNSGQSCCSVERVYVDENIHDEFVGAIQEVLKGYKLGDPFDKDTHLGPVISTRSKAVIEGHIKDAVEKGAKDLTPENETFNNPPPKGNFVKPTLLVEVDHRMAVMTDETFGPVIPIMKVKSDDEAVKLMNDSEFGLTASIWSKDTEKAYELAEQVEAGTVFVNRCDYPSPVRPLIISAEVSWKLTRIFTGSGLDGLEELGKGPDTEQVRLRPVREAEELPLEGLPQVTPSCGRELCGVQQLKGPSPPETSRGSLNPSTSTSFRILLLPRTPRDSCQSLITGSTCLRRRYCRCSTLATHCNSSKSQSFGGDALGSLNSKVRDAARIPGT